MTCVRSWPVVAALLALGACDAAVGSRPDLVVSASLGAGEALPPIRITRTAPLLDPYAEAQLGVSDARLVVALVAPDGTDEALYPYRAGADGRYVPQDTATVRAGRTYRLRVDGPAGERLGAVTTVPAVFDLVEGPPPSVVYGDGQGPGVRITETSTPGRLAAFVGSTRALAPDAFGRVETPEGVRWRSQNRPGRFRPTPFRRRVLGCQDDGPTLVCEQDPTTRDVLTGTSPVLNEAAYVALGDGTVLVRAPFIAFGYYGPAELGLVSLDDALKALVQTQAVQGGGTTLSPGEIPNVTTNIDGGLGVFGSYARIVVETSLSEP